MVTITSISALAAITRGQRSPDDAAVIDATEAEPPETPPVVPGAEAPVNDALDDEAIDLRSDASQDEPARP